MVMERIELFPFLWFAGDSRRPLKSFTRNDQKQNRARATYAN
jgi:hypothetical protein